MKISPEALMPPSLASASAAEGDAASFTRMLEGAAPKPGKAGKMRAARAGPQSLRPSTPQSPRSEPIADPASPMPKAGIKSMPKAGIKQEADMLPPGPPHVPENRSDVPLAAIPPDARPAMTAPSFAPTASPADAPTSPLADLPPAAFAAPMPPSVQAAPPGGSVSNPPVIAKATTASPAQRQVQSAQAEAPASRSTPQDLSPATVEPPPSPPSTPEAGTAKAAAFSTAKSPMPPQQPIVQAGAQQSSTAASPPSADIAPHASRATAATPQHGPTVTTGAGPKAVAPRTGPSAGNEQPDSGTSSERGAARPALATAPLRFSLLVAEAGSFRSEAQTALPGPAETGAEQPVPEASAPDQPQHLGDTPLSQSADVVISLSEDARLDVTLGAASEDDASRMEAEAPSLHADLAALGTEVEAIRVEVRRELAPDARTGSASAAWLQSGASHGWAGEGNGADQQRAALLPKGFSTRLPGAGSAGAEAGSVGKVDRYA